MDTKNINQIAKETLGLETLDTRSSDDLDFHDLSVWKIKAALGQAYNAGFVAGEIAMFNKTKGE